MSHPAIIMNGITGESRICEETDTRCQVAKDLGLTFGDVLSFNKQDANVLETQNALIIKFRRKNYRIIEEPE